jgi:hypothetical protein
MLSDSSLLPEPIEVQQGSSLIDPVLLYPVVFDRVKLEALFSHADEVKIQRYGDRNERHMYRISRVRIRET